MIIFIGLLRFSNAHHLRPINPASTLFFCGSLKSFGTMGLRRERFLWVIILLMKNASHQMIMLVRLLYEYSLSNALDLHSPINPASKLFLDHQGGLAQRGSMEKTLFILFIGGNICARFLGHCKSTLYFSVLMQGAVQDFYYRVLATREKRPFLL